ncbi:response regulator [Paenibacillus glycanilyticus]|uniref:response regulator n=1 Tax=Paenibacillus glycanilyticus TaxID=126569 RepID=UPI0020400AA6|nr:response regulator [Paenibacillus glycanilyticus]MCM3630372.1 response regulator [Paenibacillus glycanilyticus]
MNNLSLRTKGLFIIVLITFIPLGIAGVINYISIKNEMIDTAADRAASRLSVSANFLSSWLQIRRAEVVVMSRTDVVRFGSDKDKLQYFKQEMFQSDYTYHAIGYIDMSGKAIRTNGGPIDMSGQAFFKDAAKGKSSVTDLFLPSFDNLKQSLIVVPVYNQVNEVSGVVYASMPMSTMSPYFLVDKDPGAEYWLYNERGVVLFHSYSLTLGVKPSEGLLNGQPGFTLQKLIRVSGNIHINRGNEKHVLFFMKVDSEAPWHAALEMPMSSLNKGLSKVLWWTFSTITLSEIVIVILFWLYFNTIINRLKGILTVTKQAADGQFEVEHLSQEPGDEVGNLAESVNGMMEHLKDMFGRLEAIIKQNEYSFILLDENYRVDYMNQAAEKLIGYTTQELKGHATPLLFMDPDEIEREAEKLSEKLGVHVEPGLEVFRMLRQVDFSYERQWTYVHKDGTKIPVRHFSNGLRDHQGRLTGVLGMAYDMTEQVKVEKSRNLLLDIIGSAKDLIASIDHNGKVAYINKAGKRMLGLPLNYKPKDYKSYVDSSMYVYLIKGSKIAQKYGYWEGEAELLTQAGDKVNVSLVIVAHSYTNTGELYFSCIARDITEQKHIQEELIRATHEAEQANAAKSRFLAMVSHEIRTPLNGIIGLSQLMRRTGLSPSQKDYMDKLGNSSESLLRIINDLLDFSKIEAGKVEVERIAFHPQEMLSRLTDQLSVFMGGKEQFEFILEVPGQLPSTLLGDQMRVEQILLNLCMNAIKFTERGYVKLILEMAEQGSDGLKLQFAVEDTGIGMTKKQIDKLFVPFTQADGSTTRKYGGTGLGLVIANGLVKMMGGKLHVDSEPGLGSRFSFALTFPVLSSVAEERLVVSKELEDQCIWVVEDSDEMRKHWCELAESFRLTAVSFSSWGSAREKLRRMGAGAMPKLIMLDMEMPDMYGAETWLEFHKQASAAGVKTVALTTSFGRDELMQMPDSGRPYAILTKPVTRLALFHALSGTLDQKPVQVKEWMNGALEAAASAVPKDKVRILLAEDNHINQLVAIELLKERGFEVGLAENGREVLEKLEREDWHVVLMDIHMPEMDGMEATTIIRADSRYEKLPIIAVTANSLRADHEHYLQLGMNGVVTKPLDADQLYMVISNLLNNKKFPVMQHNWRGSDDGLTELDGIQVDTALARVSGKISILRQMLVHFLKDYEGFSDKLIEELENGQVINARRMIHTLMGAASHLSANDVVQAAARLGEIVKKEEGEEDWRPAAEQLKLELDRVITGLQNKSITTFDRLS